MAISDASWPDSHGVILPDGSTTMANRVGEKGQVVIEKQFRDALGVQPGSVAVQTLVDDHVEIRFYPPEHNRSAAGFLKKYVTRSISTEELREAREKAWGEAWREGNKER